MITPVRMQRVLNLIPNITPPLVLTDEAAIRCNAALEKLIDRIPREVEELRTSLFSRRGNDFIARIRTLRSLLLDCYAVYLANESDFILKHAIRGKFVICETLMEKFAIGLLEFSLAAQTAQYEAEHLGKEPTRRSTPLLLSLLGPLEEHLKEFNADDSIAALTRLDAAGFGKEAALIWIDVNNFKFLEARNRVAQLRQSLSRNESSPGSSGLDAEKPLLLAIDDNPAILAGLKGMLGTKYRFFAVTSGQAALKFLETRRPDAFIIDIEMPGMDGYELVSHIREGGQPGTIIFLTGNATREYVLKALSIGVNAFLVKPCREETLLEKLSEVLSPTRRGGN